MTWIIAANTPYGFALVLSDIRVTWKRGKEVIRSENCLQKIYPVGNGVTGFAGSVTLGFRMINEITERIKRESPSGNFSSADLAATWLPRYLRHVHSKSTDGEQALGAQVLIGNAQPHRTYHGSFPPSPVFELLSFSAPRFEPRSGIHGILSIGLVVPNQKMP